MVRDVLASITPDVLAAPRENPHNPGRPETVRSCRDLDAIQAERTG
jgi:hypothetical protein